MLSVFYSILAATLSIVFRSSFNFTSDLIYTSCHLVQGVLAYQFCHDICRICCMIFSCSESPRTLVISTCSADLPWPLYRQPLNRQKQDTWVQFYVLQFTWRREELNDCLSWLDRRKKATLFSRHIIIIMLSNLLRSLCRPSETKWF